MENPTGWVDNKIWNITARTKGLMVGQDGKNPLRCLNCGLDNAFRKLYRVTQMEVWNFF